MYKLMYVCVLGVLMMSSVAESQEQTEESEPTTNDETYCYAAGSQWICADKNKRGLAAQRAQEIRLVEEAKEKNNRAQQRKDPQVEITTMAPIPAFDTAQTGTAEEVGTNNEENISTDEVTSVTQSTQDETITAESAVQPTSVTSQGESVAAAEQARDLSTNDEAVNNVFSRWLEQYPDDWSIQVIGISNIQNLNQFYSSYGLQASDFVVVETRSKGAPWWVVLYKHFPNRDAAVAGKSELPSSLAGRAWVRPIASLR